MPNYTEWDSNSHIFCLSAVCNYCHSNAWVLYYNDWLYNTYHTACLVQPITYNMHIYYMFHRICHLHHFSSNVSRTICPVQHVPCGMSRKTCFDIMFRTCLVQHLLHSTSHATYFIQSYLQNDICLRPFTCGNKFTI